MRAAVLDSKANLSIRDIPEPVPGHGEVVITVTMAGVCGTDYSLYHGNFGVPFPVVPGHEGLRRGIRLKALPLRPGAVDQHPDLCEGLHVIAN